MCSFFVVCGAAAVVPSGSNKDKRLLTGYWPTINDLNFNTAFMSKHGFH